MRLASAEGRIVTLEAGEELAVGEGEAREGRAGGPGDMDLARGARSELVDSNLDRAAPGTGAAVLRPGLLCKPDPLRARERAPRLTRGCARCAPTCWCRGAPPPAWPLLPARPEGNG